MTPAIPAPPPSDTPQRAPASAVPATSRGRRWRRRLLWVGALLVALVFVGEMVARFALGLGDPPLYQTDPRIGYLMSPGVSHPFGNTVTINRWSQRSADVPERKGDPRERRVLVIGDSVVFGGSLTDDRDLATELLQSALARDLGAPVRVLNISCGSWGPAHQLAYVERFGTFDADAAILVLNSLDFGSVVRPGPLTWSQPRRKPVLALEEALTRFVITFLPALAPSPAVVVDEYAPTAADAEASLQAVRDLVGLLRARGVAVSAVQHLKVSELDGALLPGHDRLAGVLDELRVPIIQGGPAFKAARDRGEEPYRDDVHPTAAGQRVLADVLREALIRGGSEKFRPPSP